jgi:predicted metal-dependent hydrolase
VTAPLLVSRTLALRGRVATAIVGALESEGGVPELRRLARDFPAAPDDVETAARRLQRGFEVAEAYHREIAPTVPPFERALVQGALLFQAGLFFEVHEVLEHVWRELAGARRTVVQGLIQVAVGMHHLAHENARGALSVFASARARLASQGPVFEGVEIGALLDGLVAWESAAVAGRWSTTLALPPFVVRIGDGRRIGAPA